MSVYRNTGRALPGHGWLECVAQSALRAASVLAVVLGAATPATPALEIGFADRVRAQTVLERVYYSHQLGVRKPFEEAVPRAVVEGKVRRSLKQSLALEKFWNTPVTAEMLRREIGRMARSTRMPERLAELFAALEHDPRLVEECLARPILADRLTRNFFAYDQRVHAETRLEAEQLRALLERRELNGRADYARRSVVELVRLDGNTAASGPSAFPRTRHGRVGGALRVELAADDFDRRRQRLPKQIGDVSEVHERRDDFLIEVLLDEQPYELRVAYYSVSKRTWDSWWREVQDDLLEDQVRAVPARDLPLPLIGEQQATACTPDDTWDNGSFAIPEARFDHTAVWTGSEMIVWGGFDAGVSNGGSRYDPATDVWTATSTVDAPSGRRDHTAVWTGSEMIVWGGHDGGYLDSGGRYDPTTDSWDEISMISPPVGRRDHTAVWTGNAMLVWGGYDGGYLNSGGFYDPALNVWQSVPTAGDQLEGRRGHTAVWTDDGMLIWGGYDGGYLNNGAVFNGVEWVAISTDGAAAPRRDHTAVWTGDEMIVWGGFDGSNLDTGGRYHLGTDSWQDATSLDAPPASSTHRAVWSGSEMLIWVGSDGGRYDPHTNSWVDISLTNAPAYAFSQTAVWTGGQMIVWGGWASGSPVNSGGRYDPATDSWTPTTIGPSTREFHSAVWTGNLMVVWGGSWFFTDFDTGSRYDPTTDSWTTMSTANAPSGRSLHTAVWAGNEMIVWGGFAGAFLDTGGRYDPLTDAWTPIALDGAPSPRDLHTAVWTGSRMVIWGGNDGNVLNTGARYDPQTDGWTSTSTATNVPSARKLHTAVWSGDTMVVWGGDTGGSSTSTGGRYDPLDDSWMSVSTTDPDAPTGRSYHTAVWTGSEMIVWGGFDGGFANTGGRYDPLTDSWMPTSTSDTPDGRYKHTAVWTGSVMVIWGGLINSARLDTGGRYDPMTDSWQATSLINVPEGRIGHSAVWTGSLMVVWGGEGNEGTLRGGGRYALGASIDDDGDGFSECTGDCNDDNPQTYPDAIEVNDGQDNQCPGDPDFGIVDEISGNSGFHTANGRNEFSWTPQLGATRYELARSSRADFSADCFIFTTPNSSWTDPWNPSTSTVFFYLTRPFAPFIGSWGEDSMGNKRVMVCESGTPAGDFISESSLTLARAADGDISLTWGPSCLPTDIDYAIYQGELGDFVSHSPMVCSTGGALSQSFTPGAGSKYYLVAPRNGTREGPYGTDGTAQRPQSVLPCLTQEFEVCQ